MGNETVAIAKTANKATASGEPSYDGFQSRLSLRESSVRSVSEPLFFLQCDQSNLVQTFLETSCGVG